jgi:uncharacterized iron-regulated protein
MTMNRKVYGPLLGLMMVLNGCGSTPSHPHHSHSAAVSSQYSGQPEVATPLKSIAIDMRQTTELQTIIPQLAEKRVVYVGETHDRYEHHLNQLAVIQGIHQRYPDLAIGMEYFQWPFQEVLDRYVTGELDEREMLRKTEYFQRWRFDYRLYRPILQYAREHRIPLLALNVPAELTKKVAREGLKGLSDRERAQLPENIDRSDKAYRERLREVFKEHGFMKEADFEHFVEAQLLWDEGMARQAADYLREHPGRRLVVLAGIGHLVYRAGIPNRVNRRLAVTDAVVINGIEAGTDHDVGDYLLLPAAHTLPPRGMLGIMLNETDKGLEVRSMEDNSPALQAGMKKGDFLVSIDAEPITNIGDLRIALLDKQPGDKVQVTVQRSHWLRGERKLIMEMTLR